MLHRHLQLMRLLGHVAGGAFQLGRGLAGLLEPAAQALDICRDHVGARGGAAYPGFQIARGQAVLLQRYGRGGGEIGEKRST